MLVSFHWLLHPCYIYGWYQNIVLLDQLYQLLVRNGLWRSVYYYTYIIIPTFIILNHGQGILLQYYFLKESLFQWKATCQYLSLSLGGVLSLSEWWHWEVLTFIAGSFGAVLLAAHSIAYSLVPLLFMIPLGISIGLAKRIGHMLAEQQPMRARTMAMGTVVVVTIMATLVAIVLKVDGRNIIRIFSHDPCSLCFVVCSSQRWGVGCAMAHYHIIILFVVYLVKHDCSYHWLAWCEF